MSSGQAGERGRANALIIEPQSIFGPHLAYLTALAGAAQVTIVKDVEGESWLPGLNLIVFDPDYGEGDPASSVQALAAAAPRSAICVITGEHEPGRARSLHRAGATAVVSKAASDTELVEVLRLALDHREYTDRRVDT